MLQISNAHLGTITKRYVLLLAQPDPNPDRLILVLGMVLPSLLRMQMMRYYARPGDGLAPASRGEAWDVALAAMLSRRHLRRLSSQMPGGAHGAWFPQAI